jgi:hypothetical protein
LSRDSVMRGKASFDSRYIAITNAINVQIITPRLGETRKLPLPEEAARAGAGRGREGIAV